MPVEPQFFTVLRVNGDYAELISDEGVENLVALAMLPPEIDVRSRLRWENFQFELI